MRIRTKPLLSPQHGAESKNKRVLDNGHTRVRQLCSFHNDLLFFLRNKGPSKQIIRTTITLAEIRVVLILCLDRRTYVLLFMSCSYLLVSYIFMKLRKCLNGHEMADLTTTPNAPRDRGGVPPIGNTAPEKVCCIG